MISLFATARRSLVLALFGLGLASAAACAPASAPEALRVEPLEVVTASGAHRFDVEIAETPATMERGLMYRTSLAPDRGMLFDFKTPQFVAFWMEHTLIPLDMLFIGVDGHIVSIHSNAVPLDRTNIPSGGDVLGVLEIAGGRAAQIGAAPGDTVRHRIFGTPVAAKRSR